MYCGKSPLVADNSRYPVIWYTCVSPVIDSDSARTGSSRSGQRYSCPGSLCQRDTLQRQVTVNHTGKRVCTDSEDHPGYTPTRYSKTWLQTPPLRNEFQLCRFMMLWTTTCIRFAPAFSPWYALNWKLAGVYLMWFYVLLYMYNNNESDMQLGRW